MGFQVTDSNLSPRLLIPDNGPLSLLAMGGQATLDYLFAPGVEVWVTDMVHIEATREPDADDDQRRGFRDDLATWFKENRHRIKIQKTPSGEEYRKAMINWVAGGKKPETRPSWRGRGEASILDVLDAVENIVQDSEKVVVLVDDRKVRGAIRLTEGLNIDILSTEAFLKDVKFNHGVANATDVWIVIQHAAGRNPDGVSRLPEKNQGKTRFLFGSSSLPPRATCR